MGNKLLMLTAFHPQTDGVSECAIQTISQILQSVVWPDRTNWVDHLPLIEFAINSSVNASTGLAPSELTYRYMPHIMCTLENTPTMPGVCAFADHVVKNLLIAHDTIIELHVTQMTHANHRRCADNPAGNDQPWFDVGKLVYLSTHNLSLPKGCANKLTLCYVGPYCIVKVHLNTSNYTLELPEVLGNIVFTWPSMCPSFGLIGQMMTQWLDTMFQGWDVTRFYDFGLDNEQEYLVDEILTHCWVGQHIEFFVCFDDGDILQESYDNCKGLEALDRYLELQGILDWQQLPWHARPDHCTPRSACPGGWL